MEFKEDKDPSYNAAIPLSGARFDSTIFNAVGGGNVLQDIANGNPNLKDIAASSISRGVTEDFGTKFSCIDDLGGPVRLDVVEQGKKSRLCETLHTENEKHLKLAKAEGPECDETHTRALGDKLTVEDREAIKAYMMSLIRPK